MRGGYEKAASKMGGDKGFDGVYVKRYPSGEIQEIVITESKYRTSGRAKLGKTKYGRQMDGKWIKAKIEEMGKSGDMAVKETAKLLEANSHLIKRKINVMDKQAMNRWNQLKPPSSVLGN